MRSTDRGKARYFIIYKPYNMLSQFSEVPEGTPTLKELYDFPTDVYPVGRLDKDSEGLLILTNDKSLNHKLLNPDFEHEREYWVQVEGIPTKEALQQLEKGVMIQGYKTKAARAYAFDTPPPMPDRNPPIRYRKNVPDTWISLSLIEGKNRQVRKMTAAVGYPTLRLVRTRIENIRLGSMQPGEVKEISREELYKKLFK
jgi:23S rRNA pseudouridine2457 synthase